MSKKPTSAAIARDRLRIILKTGSTESRERPRPPLLPELSRELRDLVERHVHVTGEDVQITIEQVNGQEVLELCVRLPEDAATEGRQAQNTDPPGDAEPPDTPPRR